jgi:glucuronokinase
MDFDRKLMESRGYGEYEVLNPAKLPPLFIAYREDLSEGTEVYHNDLRARWQRGEPDVLEAIQFWADLTVKFRSALEAGDRDAMHQAINANFDRRASLYDVGEGNRDMVMTARKTGASAKFAGSGGAVVGIYDDDAMFARLEEVFAPKGIRVIKPEFAPGLATGEQP